MMIIFRSWLAPWIVLGSALLLLGGWLAFDLRSDYEEVESREQERLAQQAGMVAASLGLRLQAGSDALEAVRAELVSLLARQGGLAPAPDLRSVLLQGDDASVFSLSDDVDIMGREPGAGLREFFIEHLRSGRSSSVISRFVGLSGVERMGVVRSIRPQASPADKPLLIFLNRERSAVLAGWHKQFVVMACLFAVIVLGGVLALLLHQRCKRAYAHRLNGTESARVRAEARWLESEERYRLLFEDGRQAVMLLEDGRCIAANKAALELHGVERLEQLIGRAPGDISPPVQPDGRPSQEKSVELLRQMHEQGSGEFEWEFMRADGRRFTVHERVTAIHQGDKCLLHVVLNDITEHKEELARIEFLALHDALTGLPNRAFGQEQLQQALLSARRTGAGLAVLYLDLDNFKHVNDAHGHLKGDLLLQSVTARLSDGLRSEDGMCRLSGDEFMLLLPDIQAFEQVSDACERLLGLLAEPFEIEGAEITTSFSIGVALYPQHGGTPETLMRHADTALNEAKRAGPGQYRLFEEQMSATLQHYLQTRDALRLAIERSEFELFYQPQVDLSSGQVVGVEALLRWYRPGHGMVPPATFIGVAEESGLIVPIGRWVLREACRQAAAWHAAGWEGLSMAVNLSAVQFRQGSVEQDVLEALNDSGLDPACLELELTESVLLQDVESIMNTVAVWLARGIKLSIDDFGTGYSSLAYLKRFNVDKLKIDRSFITDFLVDEQDRMIVRSIVQIGHGLELRIIAEGVEDPVVAEKLQALGCHEAQGYLYSRPLPAAEFEQWLMRRLADPKSLAATAATDVAMTPQSLALCLG